MTPEAIEQRNAIRAEKLGGPWRCARCDRPNTHDAQVCSTCNRKRGGYIQPAHDDPDHAERCTSPFCVLCSTSNELM